MQQLYKNCKLCPRNCGVNRLAGETGFCGETACLRIGFAGIHKGEEPPLVGTGGSGTVFVCGCNLGCSFCQNWQISQSDIISQGGIISQEQGTERYQTPFAHICAMLKEKGAENINIVTGSHAIPALSQEFTAIKKSGTNLLPVVWNSSGYEKPEALELLKDHVDIYLPDLKTLDTKIAAKYFNAPDYPQTAAAAVLKMIDLAHSRNNSCAHEKVIIRHLVLPGYLDSTRSVLKWFKDNAQGKANLSLLTQYTPIPNRSSNGIALPMPDRYLSEYEYDSVLNWLDEFEIEDGFCQELVTGSEWLPDFRRTNPFSSELSIPVWHQNPNLNPT